MRAILTYHSIDSSGSPISCRPDTLDHHIAWLTSGRVQVTSVEDLLALPDSANAVALTFDDGFVNFETEAAPRLLDHGLPVTLFVVADRVGQSNSWDEGPRRQSPSLPLLDWPSLTRLQQQGVSLGGHSMTHQNLAGLSPSELETEVRGCADRIELETGRRPAGFAYPYGARDTESTLAVARVFSWACTTAFQPLSSGSNGSALPRLDMYYFAAPGSLDGWGTPWFRARLNLRLGMRAARRLELPFKAPR